jgi:hypothetical protein
MGAPVAMTKYAADGSSFRGRRVSVPTEGPATEAFAPVPATSGARGRPGATLADDSEPRKDNGVKTRSGCHVDVIESAVLQPTQLSTNGHRSGRFVSIYVPNLSNWVRQAASSPGFRRACAVSQTGGPRAGESAGGVRAYLLRGG